MPELNGTFIIGNEIPANPAPAAEKHVVQQLWPNAAGLGGVLFMTIATAAPIIAMLGNVPTAVGSGNGQLAPAGSMVAILILALFAIGYAQMARLITATGAFYGSVSHDLGQIVGVASGVTATMTYIVFEAALVGTFAFFCEDLTNTVFNVYIPWLIFAFAMLMTTGVLSYFDISSTSRVPGLCLVLEILILTAAAVAVLIHGGGSQGFVPELINPLNTFTPAKGVVSASAGIGLFFTFWLWMGFESSAMYGEESKNSKKIIPLATLLGVIGISVFYVFILWMAIVGTRPEQAIALAQDPNRAGEISYGPARQYLGEWAVGVFKLLVITGSSACGMAFYNCAACYLYVLGRENLLPSAGCMLGRSHLRHGSSHVVSMVQIVIATPIVLLSLIAGEDPYAGTCTLLALLGTMGIMVAQTLCTFAVIVYFHGNKENIGKGHWLKTGVAPLLGGMGMIYTVYLLFKNMALIAGAAASFSFYHVTPWIVLACFCSGAVIAIWFYLFDAQKYRAMGCIVLTDD